jgi:hypothetical protein
LSALFRSESSSPGPGRAISYSWRATFRGCITQGRKKTKRGRRIVLKVDYIIIIAKKKKSQLTGDGLSAVYTFAYRAFHMPQLRPSRHFLSMPECSVTGVGRVKARCAREFKPPIPRAVSGAAVCQSQTKCRILLVGLLASRFLCAPPKGARVLVG